MVLLETVLVLVLAVGIANGLAHFIPGIPASFFQIAMGLILTFGLGLRIDVDSHWFMLLFIAPLLFNDAVRFPKRELWELRGPILGNAIVLVLLTTLVGGFLIHLLIPSLPKSVALALAAVVSPTDPVAVQAIARRVKLPPNVMHIVEGESLINDATGLVSFNTAIKATVAGTFLLGEAIGNFFWISIIGAIVGLVSASLVSWLRDKFSNATLLNDVMFHAVITLLMPFLIYWVAEEVFHASGVIAVVTGGILTKILSDQHMDIDSPEISLAMTRSWEIFAYILNGVIFVLLGIEIPFAMAGVVTSTQIHTGTAILYGIVTWFIIFMLRTSWVYLTQLTYRLKHKDNKISFRIALTSGLTGVRGAVTMAAVLTVPAFVESGAKFPQRDLLIFVAAVVVIMSLLVATLMLPIVTNEPTTRDFTQPDFDDNEDTDDEHHQADQYMSEDEARIIELRYGIQILREMQSSENQAIVYDLILRKQQIIEQLKKRSGNAAYGDAFTESEQQLQHVAIKAQRDCLQQLLAQEKISPLAYTMSSQRLERLEKRDMQAYQHFSTRWFFVLFVKMIRNIRIWLADESTDRIRQENKLITRETSKAAIKALSDYASKFSADTVTNRIERQVAYNFIVTYRNRINILDRPNTPQQRQWDERMRLELELKALSAQREAIQQLYESGRITRQVGINIRQFINFTETTALAGKDEN